MNCFDVDIKMYFLFIVFTLCHIYPLSLLPFVTFTLCHLYPLSFLPFVTFTLCVFTLCPFYPLSFLPYVAASCLLVVTWVDIKRYRKRGLPNWMKKPFFPDFQCSCQYFSLFCIYSMGMRVAKCPVEFPMASNWEMTLFTMVIFVFPHRWIAPKVSNERG